MKEIKIMWGRLIGGSGRDARVLKFPSDLHRQEPCLSYSYHVESCSTIKCETLSINPGHRVSALGVTVEFDVALSIPDIINVESTYSIGTYEPLTIRCLFGSNLTARPRGALRYPNVCSYANASAVGIHCVFRLMTNSQSYRVIQCCVNGTTNSEFVSPIDRLSGR